MFNDILVIADSLVDPPSEVLPFRTVTMLCHDKMNMEVLLHTTQDMKDIFYHWMKPRGMMDYIKYIINEREWEEGVRIDVTGIYPNTIVVNWIRIENQMALLGQIRSLAGK
jgi:hypothetical protein